ncbi:flavin-containing monooxygenase 9 [Biscogniauxia sp. FL1348]|nr:flavin-containing monooxygenase 9 [Biscogniauxia sp. FL1348]
MQTSPTVAVVGAGASGLSMLKTLREDGFRATLYERRNQVGGLWAYSEDPTMTSALRITTANISKYTCGMSDFPIPDKYPHYMSQRDFQEYMESYAEHFDLFKDIVFNASLKRVSRNKEDTKWLLEVVVDGELREFEYDKVALCHGYQTKAVMPVLEGRDKFKGSVIHSQEFRSPEQFRGKKVVILGLGPSAEDVVTELKPVASKMYVSHRRGMFIGKRWRNGSPVDLLITLRRRRVSAFVQRNFPGVARAISDMAMSFLMRKIWGALDPTWRLIPFPSLVFSLPSIGNSIIPSLQDGTLKSMYGLKRFVGPNSVEFDDGTVLDDVDAVICATGYSGNFSVAPFLETSRPENYGGPQLMRLWKNMFPPQYADSMCLLCYSAFGKNNGFSFNDLISMAVSNIWRGVHPIPSRRQMDKEIDAHQKWVASMWRVDDKIDTSMVKSWEFQGFLHDAAGTGMENLGWGWKGWRFWLKDPKMYSLMNHGVETAHAFRFFETGKRKAWLGARDAIIHANEAVKIFPIEDMK